MIQFSLEVFELGEVRVVSVGASNVDEVLLEIGAVGERNPLQEQTTPLLFAVAAAERVSFGFFSYAPAQQR